VGRRRAHWRAGPEKELAGDLGGAVAPERKGGEGEEGADARARVIRQREKGPALRESWAGARPTRGGGGEKGPRGREREGSGPG
jgi:hypothetical protein